MTKSMLLNGLQKLGNLLSQRFLLFFILSVIQVLTSLPVAAAQLGLQNLQLKGIERTIDSEVVRSSGDIIIDVRTAPSIALKPSSAFRASVEISNRKIKTWPNNVVYYDIAPNVTFAHKLEIQKAIGDYHSQTQVRFLQLNHGTSPNLGATPSASEESNFVYFKYGIDTRACYSSIGMVGGRQYVLMSKIGCGTTTLIHEIGHLLGLIHEHNRCDRDQYLKVMWNNILPPYKDQFYRDCASKALGPYDYQSIMHYGPDTFTRSPLSSSMEKPDGSSIGIGMSTGLSVLDIRALRVLYP